jgi:PPOX class probable FMN-dependent enzyme
MDFIDGIAGLEALYGAASVGSQRKVAAHLTPSYRRWIEASRFCIVSTIGAGGTDGSPRGDDGPVVRVLDPKTLAMPDWRGNNRLDSLRNIVTDGRISLIFLVPGSQIMVRINGAAKLTADAGLRGSFGRDGTLPATVIVVRVDEVYAQCSRAVMRSGLWSRDDAAGLPTLGDILADVTAGEMGGGDYDADWEKRSLAALW